MTGIVMGLVRRMVCAGWPWRDKAVWVAWRLARRFGWWGGELWGWVAENFWRKQWGLWMLVRFKMGMGEHVGFHILADHEILNERVGYF